MGSDIYWTPRLSVDLVWGLVFGIEYFQDEPLTPFGVVVHLGFIRIVYSSREQYMEVQYEDETEEEGGKGDA